MHTSRLKPLPPVNSKSRADRFGLGRFAIRVPESPDVVASAHYGYKNVKHIGGIEFWRDRGAYRFPYPYPSLMDHPRAQVAFEERAVGIPGWLIRFVYRSIIASAKRKSRKGLQAYRANSKARC